MTKLRVLGGAILAAAVAAGVTAADAKPCRMAVSGDANTMDSHSQNAGNVTLVLRQIHEPLILRGKTLEKIPGLATSWKPVDPQDVQRLRAQPTRIVDGPEVRTSFFVFDAFRDELLYSNVKGENPFKDLRERRPMSHAIDTYINDEQICRTAAQMWARIGIDAKLNAMPLRTYFPKVQKDDTSLFLLGWGVPTYDALCSFQSLQQSRDGQPGNGIGNYGRYSCAEMDRLVGVMKNELDPERRSAAIHAAMRIYRDDVPHLPLHHQMIPWAMRANVKVVHMANNQLEVKWVKVN